MRLRALLVTASVAVAALVTAAPGQTVDTPTLGNQYLAPHVVCTPSWTLAGVQVINEASLYFYADRINPNGYEYIQFTDGFINKRGVHVQTHGWGPALTENNRMDPGVISWIGGTDAPAGDPRLSRT
jgi:hypothetical protein